MLEVIRADSLTIAAVCAAVAGVGALIKWVVFPIRRLAQVGEAQMSRNGGGSMVDKNNAMYAEMFEVDEDFHPILDTNGKPKRRLGAKVDEVLAKQESARVVNEARHQTNTKALDEIKDRVEQIEVHQAVMEEKQAVGEIALAAAFELAPEPQKLAVQAAVERHQRLRGPAE
jgi:hypothetical protein